LGEREAKQKCHRGDFAESLEKHWFSLDTVFDNDSFLVYAEDSNVVTCIQDAMKASLVSGWFCDALHGQAAIPCVSSRIRCENRHFRDWYAQICQRVTVLLSKTTKNQQLAGVSKTKPVWPATE
jgi:hypothetical protein